MHISTDPWVWLAAFLTLTIYSFLYKDNIMYKFAEHLFVGASVGWSIAIIWHLTVFQYIIDPIKEAIVSKDILGFILVIIPTFIGLLYFSRFSRSKGWIARWPIAVTMGYYTGISITPGIETNIFKQVEGTILTSFNPGSLSSWWALLLLVGVVTTLFYFFFSVRHTGFVGKTAKVGIWFVMIAFGASFGYTVMARVSLLIGRIQFLLHDWLGVIK
jgi:hypothetical protein